ncbi:guanine nucleotide-binding protein G(i) subunit alpha-like [Argopecten irradians]|uniref:guanine nucleotide-binding protein G(i) subunit alpha-like n=1 Tax=Argopecten irradians TaxID=31199 RepID=UPI00371156ED
MGCSGSRNIVLQVQQEHSRKIDRSILAGRYLKEVKFLLLGVSESGKTTLFRQMRIIHANGFSMSERQYYKNVIIENLMQYTDNVLRAMLLFGISFDDETSETYSNLFLMRDRRNQELLDFVVELKYLYCTPGFQACVQRGPDFCLGDGANYLFQSFDRIASPDFTPTDQDILHASVVTIGVTELIFDFKGHKLSMIDVGGNRSERMKWIHCFENTTAVIFVTAISFYYQIDMSTQQNKLHESLLVFESLRTNKFLLKQAFILFLNKMDIFKVMIKRKSLECCFPNYKGGNSVAESAQYISRMFENIGQRKSGIFCHFTTATDTANIDCMFDAAIDVILEKNLAAAGFL